jgi:hypothetical protein
VARVKFYVELEGPGAQRAGRCYLGGNLDLADLLNGVRVRAPWMSAGHPILQRAGFSIRLGYEKTINGALKEAADKKREKLLQQALVEHLVAGEKLIRLVELKSKERSKLDDWAALQKVNANPLAIASPGVASRADILKLKDQPPTFIESVVLHRGSALLFTAARSYLDRVELPTGSLIDGTAQNYEKLIGIKRIFVQTHDAIWIPKKGNYVCIATDLPRGVPNDFAEASQAALHMQLRTILGRKLHFYNFWPAIEGLYGTDSGKLVDYGFSVAGRSVNHHKARRKSECLRKALYDKAGAAAVGDDLQLFKVAMKWKISPADGATSEPEVLLPGKAIDLNKTLPDVNFAILRDGLTSRDLNFVISKLLPHIK